MEKYKKRNELVEKKWKILEKKFNAPSLVSRIKKKKVDKKAEAEAEVGVNSEDDEPDEKKDDDEPEEDEAIVTDDEGDEEVVEDEDDYVSDGGDD